MTVCSNTVNALYGFMKSLHVQILHIFFNFISTIMNYTLKHKAGIITMSSLMVFLLSGLGLFPYENE